MFFADLHCDTVTRLQAGVDLSLRQTSGHVDIPRLQDGCVGLQAFAAYVPADTRPDRGFAIAAEKIQVIRRFCETNDASLTLVTSIAEIEAAVGLASSETPSRPQRTAVLLTVENGLAIENDLGNLERLRELGVRSMTLVHSQHLDWIASCTGTGEHVGLTDVGREIIVEMSRLGMLVDVSHASEAAFWEVSKVMEQTGLPFVASHSNSASLHPHPRNLTDDQARAIAASGGMIGANFYPAFLDDAANGPVQRSKVVDHIEHFVSIVGWDHVGLGSDFDGIPETPQGLEGSDAYPSLVNDLRSRGHDEADLEKLAWENALRVLGSLS